MPSRSRLSYALDRIGDLLPDITALIVERHREQKHAAPAAGVLPLVASLHFFAVSASPNFAKWPINVQKSQKMTKPASTLKQSWRDLRRFFTVPRWISDGTQY